MILAAGTGLRQCEIFGLTVDRLDLERRTVLVNRQLINVNGREPFFGPPKSQASVRVVPLPLVVVDATQGAPAEPTPRRAFVFTQQHGAPLRRSAFWTEWNRALEQAAWPASASETLDTYSHLWPDNDERTRAAVDGVLRNFADLLRTNGGDQTHHRRSEA